MELTEELNQEQLSAVTHADGPVLVLAGAGSGKTLVLAYRYAYLVAERGIHPDRLMALTFTNRAAKEMIERIRRFVPHLPYRPWVSTFHSACVRILREHGEPLGIKPDFVIYDESDQAVLLRRILKDLGLSEKTLSVRLFKSIWDNAANKLLMPESLATNLQAETAEAFYAAADMYRRLMESSNALDFGQLLTHAVAVLRTDPKVQKHYQDKFQHILVDEFQDTNTAQYELLKLLANAEKNLFVVGDDDQSIYSWRGAEPENLFRFEREFKPDVVVLNRNYRSTQIILDAANEVISKNVRLRPKHMETTKKSGANIRLFTAADEYDEAAFIVERIEELKKSGEPLREVAVFYRTNAQSRVLEEELVNRRMPYIVVGGLRFYERKEVKDMLSYLTLIANPRCYASFVRAIQFPRRGIGSGTIEKISKLAARENIDLLQAARSLMKTSKLTATIRAGLEGFLRIIEKVKRLSATKPADKLIKIVADETGFEEAYLKEGGEVEATARMENIFELAAAAKAFFKLNPDAALGDFLEQASLTTNLDSSAGLVDAVSLMTLHCAKGLEFETVFLVGLEEGLLPHHRNMEDPSSLAEERRLCYVGMTRAKSNLILSYSLHRSGARFFTAARPSRFLREIPPDSIERVGRWQADTPEQLAMPDLTEVDITLSTGQLVEHPAYGKGQIIMPTPNARGRIAVIFFGRGLGAKEVDPNELVPL